VDYRVNFAGGGWGARLRIKGEDLSPSMEPARARTAAHRRAENGVRIQGRSIASFCTNLLEMLFVNGLLRRVSPPCLEF